jgi:DNA modification methylase
LLGDHRLYCGDARDERAYDALMKGTRAGFVFSDPPYNVPIDGHVSGLGRPRLYHLESNDVLKIAHIAEFMPR